MHEKYCKISPLLFGSCISLLTCELARLNKKIWLILTSLSARLHPFFSLPSVSLAGFPLFFCLAVGETKGTKEREETVSFSSTVVSGGVELSIECWTDWVDWWCSEN